MLNFEAYNLTSKFSNATVDAYEMDYGKGKVINLGIWGHTLVFNKAFLNYFDNVIIPMAFINAINSKINNYPSFSESIQNNTIIHSNLKGIIPHFAKLKEQYPKPFE